MSRTCVGRRRRGPSRCSSIGGPLVDVVVVSAPAASPADQAGTCALRDLPRDQRADDAERDRDLQRLGRQRAQHDDAGQRARAAATRASISADAPERPRPPALGGERQQVDLDPRIEQQPRPRVRRPSAANSSGAATSENPNPVAACSIVPATTTDAGGGDEHRRP